MNIGAALFSFALLLCEIRAQFCGPPILPPPLNTPVISTSQQIIPVPPVGAPVVGTTIIDNSLSSALANVLQLLIVSDLIESTLNTALGHHPVPLPNTVCEPIVPQPIVYSPTIEPCSPIIDFIPPRGPFIDVIPQQTPIFDFIPKFGPVLDVIPPCAPVIEFTPPGLPIFDFVPQYGPVMDCKPCAPVFDFIPPSGPIIEFMPQISPVIEYPCGPVFDYPPPCCPFVDHLPNFYGEYVPTPNYCGGVTEYVTYAPNFIGCSPDIIGPVQISPPVPNCYNGIPELACPCGNMAPLGACNFGNVPASLPCVSLNVEPLPCGCGYGSNIITNPYFY